MNWLKSLLLLSLFPVGAGNALAQHTVEQDGIYYLLDNDEATVFWFTSDKDTFIIPENITINGNDSEMIYVVTALDIKHPYLVDAATYISYPGHINLYLPKTINYINWNPSFWEISNLYIPDLKSWCDTDFYYSMQGGSISGTHYESNSYILTPDTKLYVNDELVETLTIPEDVTSIPPFAFYNLNCKKIITGNGLTTINMHAFENSSAEELVMGDNLEKISDFAFKNCKKLKKLTLSPRLERIGLDPFPGGITEVYSPSAEVIAFLKVDDDIYHGYLGSSLGDSYELYIDNIPVEDLEIKALKPDLGNCCFEGVNNVKSICLDEGIKSAGYNSFSYCKSLKSLTFPATFEKISTNFWGCPSLESITFKNPVPPALIGNPFAFYDEIDEDVTANCTLYVPEESVDLYKSDWIWGQFQNILPIEGTSGIEEIGAEDAQSLPKGVYDLQGRKVSGENLVPGIYVIDGKKIKI